MTRILRFDHIGVTVHDLDRATAFFTALGFEVEGRTAVEGDFIDTVIGIPDSRTDIVMLRPPGGGTAIELSRFSSPIPRPLPPAAEANDPGLRSIALEVDDLRARSIAWPAKAMASWAASASTRACGGWRTCGGRRGFSWRWRSGSAERGCVRGSGGLSAGVGAACVRCRRPAAPAVAVTPLRHRLHGFPLPSRIDGSKLAGAGAARLRREP
jgi:catechol 2,3-dioxygenase-like lactoylglutathione lyase family enzyme